MGLMPRPGKDSLRKSLSHGGKSVDLTDEFYIVHRADVPMRELEIAAASGAQHSGAAISAVRRNRPTLYDVVPKVAG
jgi:hypothetical protein